MSDQPHSWKSSLYQTLHIEDFASLVPKHLFSSIENEPILDPEAATNRDSIYGITEWAAPWGAHQLSFGLDWSFNKSNRIMAARWTTLRTNVIVVDTADVDQGQDCLHLCVALMMTRARWEELVVMHLRLDKLH